MPKHINAPKTFSIAILAFNLLVAQEDNIIAKYCLSSDKDGEWELLSYERFIPLTIKIQTKSNEYNGFLGANLNADIKFISGYNMNTGSFGCTSSLGTLKKGYICRGNTDIEYNIYDYLDTLHTDYNLPKIDSAGISVLFEKVFPVKWNLDYSIDNQPLNISGIYNVKISGFCNKEQLKKIEKSIL
ncbi:MAG: hypothetical protein LBH25_15310 [Fibromonadaceae bacterium]|nr:hypothetical protein [Fibromonadaceae bacterium]